ncbi:MAG: hypothetical protein P8124_09655 [Gammaproteobacteria bacterium]
MAAERLQSLGLQPVAERGPAPGRRHGDEQQQQTGDNQQLATGKMPLLVTDQMVDQHLTVDRALRIHHGGIGNLPVNLRCDLSVQRLQPARPVAQGFDGDDQTAGTFQGIGYRFGGAIQMFCHQLISERGDGQGGIGIALCLEGEVALRVQPHGPVAEIGRSHPRQAVVGNHDLGVYVQRAAVQVRHHRIVHPQPVVVVGGTQSAQQAGPQYIHGVAFKPTARGPGQHDDNLRALLPAQRLDQRVAHGGRGQVLVFHVQPVPGVGNGVQIEALHLPDFLLPLIPG